jgi:hypothetical protein
MTRFQGVVSAIVAIFMAAFPCAFAQNVTARGVGSAALTVQVGLLGPDGKLSPVSSATVYVMYGSLTADPALSQETSTDTAGAQFRIRFKQLLSEDRELKNLEKRNRRGGNTQLNDTISLRALRDLDEALAATRDWIAHHPDYAWQLRTVTPDRHGEWTVTGLDPGPYEIVARGKYAQYEVDWEANASLRSEMTLTLPMTSPRYIARADK